MAPAPQPRPADRPQRLGPTLAVCALWLLLAGAAVARLTGGLEAWTYEAQRRQLAAQGGLHASPLPLRDAQGRTWTAFEPASAPRPVYLVDFIYTRCPTVCQALGSEYYRMQQALQASGRPVGLLSVSIDPQHDDQAALAAYAELHQAAPGHWRVAAPRSDAAAQAALRELGVVAVPDGLGGFVHNGSIHLIDANGRVHGVFDYAQWPEALARAERLAGGAR